MNLLRDAWIPVSDGASPMRHVTLKEVLCADYPAWKITLPRDDMEMAALQLAICLTQVVFMPANARELREREKTPMPPAEYDKGCEQFASLFDVLHAEHPFMQVKAFAEGKKTKNVSVQKLLIGMPNSDSASGAAQALFHRADEVERVCLPCAAVALFQEATNGVSLGGAKFIVGLKGMAPATTLVSHSSLRTTVWRNVLHEEFLRASVPEHFGKGCTNEPTWKTGLSEGGTLNVNQTGLLRGLFWQPARVQLRTVADAAKGICHLCGQANGHFCAGFTQQALPYKKAGFWRHPHTPTVTGMVKGKLLTRSVQVDAAGRFWTQLAGYFWEDSWKDGRQAEGYSRALVVRQHEEVWRRDRISLAVGGYINERESILGRRHEMYSLAEGWEDQGQLMRGVLDGIEDVSKGLETAVDVFVAEYGKNGLGKEHKKHIRAKVTNDYIQRSEPDLHSRLRTIADWQAALRLKDELRDLLCDHARATFLEVFALADRLHARSDGRKWSREDLYRV